MRIGRKTKKTLGKLPKNLWRFYQNGEKTRAGDKFLVDKDGINAIIEIVKKFTIRAEKRLFAFPLDYLNGVDEQW